MKIGRIELDMNARRLRRDGQDIRLGSRAFDLLATLASANGRVVSRSDLMSTVWPGTVVEDCNIDVNISALRKALGDDRDLIVTVARRGYRLAPSQDVQPKLGTAASTRPLPRRVGNLIGREVVVAKAAEVLADSQVLTLTGIAGVGKSSLALELAYRIAPSCPATVAFVDLASAPTIDEVLSAIAYGCGIEMPEDIVSSEYLGAALSNAPWLLILDGAEHVISAVAQIVEALLTVSPGIQFLVTSREPLKIRNETVFRVDPLAVPKLTDRCDEMLNSPAVQLFVHHAQQMHPRFVPRIAEIASIGKICQRLDGIPLAIELAAGRAELLGVEGVQRLLSDGLSFLSGGYRTATSRHRCLQAALDVSFDLLSDSAQSLLVQLYRFAGPFNFDSLRGVVNDMAVTTRGLIENIDELVSKSLVNVCIDGPEPMYSLFECIRTFVAEKFQCASDEHAAGRAVQKPLAGDVALPASCLP
ncbi:winged helix-turn-helix domain-containing protein [Paraburkholderia sp. MMS20-SJTN17]|uniref:Winged helix-turn-helix domain-containing protein n=1 Tax=Paraburkholderia translucens TaxID=2886945 RepID=A0ABS8KDG9_9BURK|nr:winged helix-turn-helix domain-containing protein [Paraburkholderia sp. MMS20-SJTN17]MCC8402447.1 winged helix-turn-helix domain-containing protein [Paraburkholderia sp. MMS20-SJTN17]